MSLETVPTDQIELSEPYVDARDGNNSRPYCISIRVPEPNRRATAPKYRHVYIVRQPTMENAVTIFNFFCDELEDNPECTTPAFIKLVTEVQSGTNVLARKRSLQAHNEATADAA